MGLYIRKTALGCFDKSTNFKLHFNLWNLSDGCFAFFRGRCSLLCSRTPSHAHSIHPLSKWHCVYVYVCVIQINFVSSNELQMTFRCLHTSPIVYTYTYTRPIPQSQGTQYKNGYVIKFVSEYFIWKFYRICFSFSSIVTRSVGVRYEIKKWNQWCAANRSFNSCARKSGVEKMRTLVGMIVADPCIHAKKTYLYKIAYRR